MAQEIEAKLLNVDVEAIEVKLTALGAKKIGDFFFRSTVFDFPGFPLDGKNAWVRLRDEGLRVMLAFKQRLGATVHDGSVNDAGMEEVEVVVGDFEKTKEILFKIGMIEKFSQEKKRTEWRKGDMVYDIDIWPKLAPYLEVEGPSWEKVDVAIAELGLDPTSKKICSTTQVYALSGINDKDYISMTFNKFVKRP